MRHKMFAALPEPTIAEARAAMGLARERLVCFHCHRDDVADNSEGCTAPRWRFADVRIGAANVSVRLFDSVKQSA